MSSAAAACVQAESEYIASYAEKATEVLRRMENGVYGVVDKAGVRSYKVRGRVGLDVTGAISCACCRHLSAACSCA